MAKKAVIHHNLSPLELEETLEKALKGVKAVREPPKPLDDPFLENRAVRARALFFAQIAKMATRIAAVIAEE